MKKLFAIFLALLITIYFIRSPKHENSKEISQMMMASDAITHNEMNDFLRIWSEYLQNDVSKIGARQISLTVGTASEKLPIKTINWLAAKGWNADRFFFVEQRLKAIVKSALLQDHIKSTIRVLETQMGSQGVDSTTIRRMIDEQKQRINVEKISPAEIDMVSPNLVLISDILDGTKPYQYIK